MRTKAAFWAVLVALNLGVVILLDWAVGAYRGFSVARESRRMFIAEVAPLLTRTQSMQGGLRHSYVRDEGDQGPGEATFRVVRTDAEGTIIGPQQSTVSHTGLLFLGGSTTETNEVDEGHRFPYLSGKILSEKLGRSVVGINLGVRGHTTQDAINLYLNHPSIVASHASVVVLMENINDRLFLAQRGTLRADITQAPRGSARALYESVQQVGRAAWDYAAGRSNLLYLIQHTTRRNAENDPAEVTERNIDFVDQHIQQSKETYESNLRTFVVIVRSRYKTPVLMTQPLGRPSQQQGAFNDIVRRVAEQLQTKLIDLDAHFPQERSGLFFPDLIHMNNVGSRLAAGIIADELHGSVFGKTMSLPKQLNSLRELKCEEQLANAVWDSK